MADTAPVAIAIALDVSIPMAMMDVLTPAVDGVNRLADALQRSDRHVFAGCVAFSTGARVLDRAELSALTWDFEYMTDLKAGIEVASTLLPEHQNRRLGIITALCFETPQFPEPSGYPGASDEHLRSWLQRAMAWNDDREADEVDRVLDALAKVVRRGVVVDVIMCQTANHVPRDRHRNRLGELATASGGIVGVLTAEDVSSFASLSTAIGLPS